MKNFSNAVVFSVVMLSASNAFAINKTEAVKVVNIVAAPAEAKDVLKRLNDKRTNVMTLGDRNAVLALVLNCKALLGSTEASASQRAKVVAVLKTLEAKLTAAITAQHDVVLVKLATEINALLVRIDKSWKKLNYKNNVYPREKGKFLELTTQALLNAKLA